MCGYVCEWMMRGVWRVWVVRGVQRVCVGVCTWVVRGACVSEHGAQNEPDLAAVLVVLVVTSLDWRWADGSMRQGCEAEC